MKGEQQNLSAKYFLAPVCTPRWAEEVERGMARLEVATAVKQDGGQSKEFVSASAPARTAGNKYKARYGYCIGDWLRQATQGQGVDIRPPNTTEEHNGAVGTSGPAFGHSRTVYIFDIPTGCSLPLAPLLRSTWASMYVRALGTG